MVIRYPERYGSKAELYGVVSMVPGVKTCIGLTGICRIYSRVADVPRNEIEQSEGELTVKTGSRRSVLPSTHGGEICGCIDENEEIISIVPVSGMCSDSRGGHE
ncbi:hypothetical protein QAD02_002631 [Eretmocerus hayati]|uniref:Uncharacterized protein n=2 Tax=Eretmocerus hayati TaxID=131215 RepID=A0ACC2NJV9_9HYME|nr:hypothetical protein QAD02_002630 [Eretmocerus hayati]KAJ8671372.1 hypothetical protein QAD02_002631 [Eretmocerus hayati]